VTTDADSWPQLSALLDAALDQPAAARQQWIEALPQDCAPLKPRLRELIARAAELAGDDFLQALPKVDLESTSIADQSDKPGDSIGPYRLVRELGRGGMGAVWLAERSDGLINRPVALKLPHSAFPRAGLAERMAREREILATLTHPNIARLYDAGLTDAGQPYLALEYVEGQPIDVYCQQHQLGLKQRLALFAQLSGAMAYAHGKLVVHRDLKPANVLVTADGQVRVLDFGIAKLLHDNRTQATQLTELSGRALTPDYASPEQILGAPLTVTSDVYSLGVVLYELIGGTRPYKLKRDSRGALEDAILHAEPPRPSEIAERSLRGALRGDLDTIVLKALKKEPDERYPTVHALLDDVERYLAGRPVLAQPDSAWYRIGKFTARNRLAVSLGAAVFAALVIGASVAAWQAQVARAEQARAQEVKEFIAAVFREADPTQGKGGVLSAAELLRQAERRLQDRGAADPRMRLELLAILGESLFGLQENADAARVTEQALQLQESAGIEDDALKGRLHLLLSQTYELLGRNDEALAELDRTFAVLDASRQPAGLLLVRAKLQRAALGIVFADYPRAEQAAQEAIAAASAVLGPRSPEVATGLQQLSHVYTLTQRREMAVEPARRAYDLLLELHGGDPGHPQVIETAKYYGQALHVVGEFDKATVVYSAAVVHARRTFGEDSRAFGEALSAFVPLQIDIGDLQPAIANARQAIAIYLQEGQPGSVTHAGRVRKLANALLAARSTDEAARQSAEAVRLADAAQSKLEALHARGSYGLALAYLGRFEDADRTLRQTIEQAGSGASRGKHLAMRNLGTSLRLQGRHAEALQWLEQAIEAAAIQRSHRIDLAQGLVEAGLAKLELGEVDAAQSYFTRAEELFADVQGRRMTPARTELSNGMARARQCTALARPQHTCP
jgi:eukaryotic-like serine/threonine-protein kinase